jgi:hypothetical protein
MDETRISKRKRCSKNLCSQATRCHPRYKLPIQHHKVQENLRILNIRGRGGILCRCGKCRHLLQLEMVNRSLEVINLIILVHELKIMLVHLLLTVLQFLLQLCDLLGLHTLELLKLTSLSSGGLLCLPDKATVPKQLLVALGRLAVDSQELLVLVAEATL